jgi:membrane protease YdiL (CAAX protease family)
MTQPHRDAKDILETSLLAETVFVTTAAILLVKVFTSGPFSSSSWLICPMIMVVAALLPTAAKGRDFPALGFVREQRTIALRCLYRTCLIVFPFVFLLYRFLHSLGMTLPLLPVAPRGPEWLGWLFYQFLYIAVAEELFFRGYLQANILRLAKPAARQSHRLQQWWSIAVSAGVFAIAHVIIGGRITALVTFLPGLVLAWLFVRTRSLLAPILFHGLANCFYCFLAATPI